MFFTAYHIIFYVLLLSTIVLYKSKEQKVLLWIMVTFLIFFTGLRNHVNYADLANYLIYYDTGEQVDLGFGTGAVNWGYEILNKSLRYFDLPFQVLLFLISFFIYASYAKFIDKYSPNKMLSLTIFYLTGYMFSLIILRQFIAVCIGLLSFKYVIERKQLKFLLAIGAALLFHSTAIILAPVYYLYGIKTNKRNMALLFAVFVAFAVTFSVVSNSLAGLSEYYSHYVGKEEETSIVRTLMKTYIMILFVLILKKDVVKKNINFLLLICLALNVLVYIGGNAIFGLYRLRIYFEISEIIGIPVALYYTRKMPPCQNIAYNSLIFIYFCLLFMSFDRMVNNEDILFTKEYSWCF